MSELESLLFRFSLSLIINGIGIVLVHFKQHLKYPSGVLAAFSIGVALFTIYPFIWFLLLTFFVSSSLLTRFKAHLKLDVQDKFEKGGQRDGWQVLANGFSPVIFSAIAFFFTTDNVSPFFIASVTYFASVNADTFSTEIGILAKSSPRWILNPRKSVEKGTSGGISTLGSLAGVIGALEIAVLLAIWMLYRLDSIKEPIGILIAFAIVFIGGVIGGLIDSLLGASIQGYYFCPTCQSGTEKRVHLKCGGTETQLMRGWKIITNDWVNFLSATTASLFVGFIWVFLN